jgi:hypothetical protein
MADAMYDALTMDEQRRGMNHSQSQEFVMRNTRYVFLFCGADMVVHGRLTISSTSAAWGRSFVPQLKKLERPSPEATGKGGSVDEDIIPKYLAVA